MYKIYLQNEEYVYLVKFILFQNTQALENIEKRHKYNRNTTEKLRFRLLFIYNVLFSWQSENRTVIYTFDTGHQRSLNTYSKQLKFIHFKSKTFVFNWFKHKLAEFHYKSYEKSKLKKKNYKKKENIKYTLNFKNSLFN